MEAFLSRPPVFLSLLAGLVLATLGALILFPPITPLPMVLAVVLWLVVKAPVRYPVFILWFLVLTVDCSVEVAYAGMWKSPLTFIGRLIFINLNAVTGVPGLSFTLLDLSIFGLTALITYRRATGMKIDAEVTPLPRPIVLAMGLVLVTIVWMFVWGLLNGGDRRPALWQFQKMMLLPFFVLVFSSAVRGPEDFRLIARIVIIGAFVKAFLGAFFIVFIARPRGLAPEYATVHSDTMIYVTGLAIAITQWTEEPNWKNFRKMVLVCGVILMGMHYNDRRLAYASFNQSLVAIFLISPWSRVKLYASRIGLLMMPLFLAYIVVGWSNPTGVFSPVNTFKSMLVGEHKSDVEEGVMDYRDMENYNVIMTWQRNPILGTGYGHPFDEVMKLPDISHLFEDYLYHPHNSVLGILAFGGVVGFTGLWLFLVVTVFLAVRSYHRARPPEWRAAGLVAVAVVVAYTNQCFGDMGSTSWLGTILTAMAVTCTGKLAVRTGAWPAPGSAPVGAGAPGLAGGQVGEGRT